MMPTTSLISSDQILTFTEHVDLTFLDAVLHVATGAVELLVEEAGRCVALLERGNDEARVRLAARPLGFGDHAALSPPAVKRRPGKVLEAARRRLAFSRLGTRLDQLSFDAGDEPRIARKAEHVINAVFFAPAHDLVAREP